ncbi:MAG: SIMPL domain-containing protein [Gemmatimonadota bacterium]|nr:SIMPL domain-containing protein [Gemmatimonadota bacterium]
MHRTRRRTAFPQPRLTVAPAAAPPVVALALAVALTVALASVLAATPAAAQPLVPAGNVSASGTASITVEPDLALVTIQYSASGRTPAIAGRAAARRANAIRAAIIALGVPADSPPTTGSSGWWWGSWGNRSNIQVTNSMRDTAYVTNDAFVVRLHDLSLVGRVIDTALTEGAQTISNVEFQATNTRDAQLEAIRQATREARGRAAAVAEASGLALGRVLNMSVNAPPRLLSMARTMNEGLMDARIAGAATTVVAPELKVDVSVNGSWEMVVGRP